MKTVRPPHSLARQVLAGEMEWLEDGIVFSGFSEETDSDVLAKPDEVSQVKPDTRAVVPIT